MTIHITPKGIFADTEKERLAFYDRLCAGDPTIIAEIELYRMIQKLEEGESDSG